MRKKMISFLLVVTLLLFSVPLSGAAEDQFEAGGSGFQTLGRELIVTGSLVWQIVDRVLLCTDISAGKTVASLPILPDAFLPRLPGSELYRINLLSGGEGSVLICGAFLSREGMLTVLLLEFALDDDRRIMLRSSRDLTPSIGPFFESDSGFLQVDMVSWENGLFLTVMDEDFNCHLCWYPLNAGSVSELGQLPYAMLTAAIPFGDHMLLAGDSLSADTDLSLAVLSIPDGGITPLSDIPARATVSAQNFAYDAETDRIFYTLRNAAYRVDPRNGNIPEPVAVFPAKPASFGKGAIASGRYVVQSENGDLLSCDIRGTLAAAPVRIMNCTENTDIEETAAWFNALQQDCFLSVERMDTDSSLQANLHRFSEYDALLLSLSSPEFHDLLLQEYCADLSVSGILRKGVSEMDTPVRNALYFEDSLAAFPFSLETPCLTLNVPAMAALTGLSPDQLPEDWPGFLALLSDMADSKCFLSHPEYAITVSGTSPDEFRQMMLICLLRSVLLDASAHADSSVISEALPSLLSAFEKVDWQHMGLQENQVDRNEDIIPVIDEELYEITTAYRNPGVTFWPLATAPGRDPFIPGQISVLLLNKSSVQLDSLLQWAEFTWQQSEIAFRMSLCPEMNDPVPNDEYESTVEELEDILRSYQMWLEEITDPAEAEAVRSEARELLHYLESYRSGAVWLVSEESLSDYRSRSFAPDPYSFWETDEGLEILDDYLAGDLSEESLISWILSLVSVP